MTPGQAAYEKWAGSFTTVAYGNAEEMNEVAKMLDRAVPPWWLINEAIKARWELIAKSAIDQHIDNRDEIEQDYKPDIDPEELQRRQFGNLPDFSGTLRHAHPLEAKTIFHSMCTRPCGPECDAN